MRRELADLTFEQWLHYVFDHPVASSPWYDDEDAEHWCGSAATAVAYLTQLFSDPRRSVQGFSDEQLNQGFWFLLHPSGCDEIEAFFDADVPWQVRQRGLEAIFTLFEQLFAERCNDRLSHLDERGTRPLNSICYMWWDLFTDRGPEAAHSQAPFERVALEVLSRILALKSQACQESALHGLGHFHNSRPGRVERVIDDYLARNPKLRLQLRDYARNAREGDVL